MTSLIQKTLTTVLDGDSVDRQTALQLAAAADQEELWAAADRVRNHFHGADFSLCSIINARSGRCSEDCRFCAQSARHHTGVDEYEIAAMEQALAMAEENDRHGVHRFSLVTSGRSVSMTLLDKFAAVYQAIDRKTSLQLCGSMGLLTPEKSRRLKEMGVSRYHCNLETCRNFFPRICTTHTWEEKVETLKMARDAGMSLCSGGIIGMGESTADRIDLAMELRELAVDSIPLNILTPIAGTPLADRKPLAVEEVLTAIALFRFINPLVVIRIAGGRQQLGRDQYRCFTAGANGAMVGNYLTTIGNAMENDLRTFSEMGFTLESVTA
ncbi:biotin synthase [bacterium BMS3Bbin14]|nr:biotin synthase [bacterium BMS3Bbin14]HDL98227.1 biotin synthase BioB [Desulfobacteraceae bacterium]HDZ76303.1 biotin synthase BioB [Desulfobacteraceae bacterium]